jgi:hypothetical protein
MSVKVDRLIDFFGQTPDATGDFNGAGVGSSSAYRQDGGAEAVRECTEAASLRSGEMPEPPDLH